VSLAVVAFSSTSIWLMVTHHADGVQAFGVKPLARRHRSQRRTSNSSTRPPTTATTLGTDFLSRAALQTRRGRLNSDVVLRVAHRSAAQRHPLGADFLREQPFKLAADV
jgi:hypothetical protein